MKATGPISLASSSPWAHALMADDKATRGIKLLFMIMLWRYLLKLFKALGNDL